MSTRKYRLCDGQRREVVEGLRLRLMQLLEEKEDLEAATHALHALHRLTDPQQQRPRYPKPVTWDLIESYLKGDRTQLGQAIRPQNTVIA